MAIETQLKEEKTTKAPKATKPSKKEESKAGFAVIKTGGKQYKVKEGDMVTIEKIKGEFKVGDKISFDEVLLTSADAVTLGTPFIKGAKVAGEIAVIGRNKTVTVIKYKQKSRYFKKNGHRQPHFKVRITSIA